MKVVTVPFLNPTENVARIVAVFVTQGDQISKGSVLFELETAKATTEVVSPSDGYVVGLDVAVGDSRKFGDRLMWVADSADEDPPISDRPEYSESAPAIAKTEETASVADGRIPALIFGAGPQGKTVAEMLSSSNMVYVRGFIDPNIPIGTEVHGIPVLGADADVKYLVQGRLHMGYIAVGWLDPSAQLRTDLFSQNNENKLMMPPVVHPTAFVDPTAVLGYGVQIHAGAHVGADAVIADGSMISTNAVVSHGSYIGEHTHIAPGAILAGNVTVGAKCLIGMGVTVFAGLSIKSGLTVLNGQDIFTSLG